MKPALSEQNGRIALEEDHICFGGMKLTYQLLLNISGGVRHFSVRVLMEKESAEADAGYRLPQALDYYHSILFGAVTPCTLDDVMHDLRSA